MLNFCINCKHHNGASRFTPLKHHKCHHPSLKLAQIECPVTGKIEFRQNYETEPSEDQHPYCKDINTNARCDLYESK